MRHLVMLDIDNPFDPEVTLIVNGFESRMSYEELRKLMLDCEWAYTTINNARNVHPVRHYVELATGEHR